MVNLLKRFWAEDEAQDLIEYTLLLAFVCLVAAAIFIGAGNSTASIWTIANEKLSSACSAAAAGS